MSEPSPPSNEAGKAESAYDSPMTVKDRLTEARARMDSLELGDNVGLDVIRMNVRMIIQSAFRNMIDLRNDEAEITFRPLHIRPGIVDSRRGWERGRRLYLALIDGMVAHCDKAQTLAEPTLAESTRPPASDHTANERQPSRRAGSREATTWQPPPWLVVSGIVIGLLAGLSMLYKGCLEPRLSPPRLKVEGVVPVFVYRAVKNPVDSKTTLLMGGVGMVVCVRAERGSASISELRVCGKVNLVPLEYPEDPAHPYLVDGQNFDSILSRIAALKPYVLISWVGAPTASGQPWKLDVGELQYAAFEILKPVPVGQRDPTVWRPPRRYVGHGDGSLAPSEGDPLAQASLFFSFRPGRQTPEGLRPEVADGLVACSLVTNRGVVAIPFSKFRTFITLTERNWDSLPMAKVYSYSEPEAPVTQ